MFGGSLHIRRLETVRLHLVRIVVVARTASIEHYPESFIRQC